MGMIFYKFLPSEMIISTSSPFRMAVTAVIAKDLSNNKYMLISQTLYHVVAVAASALSVRALAGAVHNAKGDQPSAAVPDHGRESERHLEADEGAHRQFAGFGRVPSLLLQRRG